MVRGKESGGERSFIDFWYKGGGGKEEKSIQYFQFMKGGGKKNDPLFCLEEKESTVGLTFSLGGEEYKKGTYDREK